MRFLFLLLILVPVGCFGGGDPAPTPVVLDGMFLEPDATVAPEVMIPLTRVAGDLRRVRDEHSGLISSIPPAVLPTPTLTVEERSIVTAARVRNHPDGVPIPSPVGSDWFDPGLGIRFYRDSGGDWSARRVRESHTHRDLFYYDRYPGSVPNFMDKTIYPHLARELVFGAVDALPALGSPTPAMIDAFGDNLGWEIPDSPEPVVNLWTTFVVRRTGGIAQVYAVGGVMRLGVSSTGEGDDLLEFLTPGDWLGPVVVERLS